MLERISRAATYYYHPDHLGSVSVVSNHKGEPYERVEYLPFGEIWIEDTDSATSYIPFRFTSKELDEETGLYYYGARYYEPKMSRWMSADPAGFALINPNRGGYSVKGRYSVIEATNWYSYVSNNPVRYVDPTGMYDWEDYDTGLPKENNSSSSHSSSSGSSSSDELTSSQSSLNNDLMSSGYQPTKLSDQVNIKTMVRMFKKHSGLLDKKTGDFVKDTSRRALRKLFSDVNVFILDKAGMNMVKDAMKKAGVPSYIDNPGGIGFGNSIYMEGDAWANDLAGDLLGHESVHTLQTEAYGGLGGMYQAYGSDMGGMETAAYEFGGGGTNNPYTRKTQRESAGLDPVFQETPIRKRRRR